MVIAVSAVGIFITFAYAKDLVFAAAPFKNTQNINRGASEKSDSNRLSEPSGSEKGRLKVEELRYLMKIL